MSFANWSNEKYQLYFDVLRSIRYHDRRRSYFAFMHKITNALTMMLSGSVIFTIAHEGAKDPMWLTWMALAAAVLSVFDLVVGYSACESVHDSLKRRFADLQIAIETSVPAHNGLMDWQALRIKIEVDEPPAYRALDLLCHNELLRAQGFSGDDLKAETKVVLWYERWTCHLFKWADIAEAQDKRQPKAA